MSETGIVTIERFDKKRGQTITREYKTVAKRVEEFRTNPGFAGWSIICTPVGSATDWPATMAKLVESLPADRVGPALDFCISQWNLEKDQITIECQISDPQGRVMANGHASELVGGSVINQTSALENCETSAIGRALANIGFGGAEFASADELAGAIAQQSIINGQNRVPNERQAPRPTSQPPKPPEPAKEKFEPGVMTFSKHKGKHVSELSTNSLKWFVENYGQRWGNNTATHQADFCLFETIKAEYEIRTGVKWESKPEQEPEQEPKPEPAPEPTPQEEAEQLF